METHQQSLAVVCLIIWSFYWSAVSISNLLFILFIYLFLFRLGAAWCRIIRVWIASWRQLKEIFLLLGWWRRLRKDSWTESHCIRYKVMQILEYDIIIILKASISLICSSSLSVKGLRGRLTEHQHKLYQVLDEGKHLLQSVCCPALENQLALLGEHWLNNTSKVNTELQRLEAILKHWTRSETCQNLNCLGSK